MNNGNGAAARRRALMAGAIGNFVEWYDFALYGFFATTIATLFFPNSNPTAALLSTFAILGVSFVVRPLGGVVFGHLGDRLGRRATLLLSVGVMSAATVGIGLLPGYAQVGLWAPVLLLLCKLVQGFSAGGEYSSSTILVTEHAPSDRRGLYASIGPATSALTLVVTLLASLMVTSTTTSAELESWGWRTLFLAALPLGLIGLWLRRRVDETPTFAELQAAGQVQPAPVMQALRAGKKSMLVLIGMVAPLAVGEYFTVTFLNSYLTMTAKFSKSDSLFVILVAELVYAGAAILAGHAIDRLGRKRVAVASALCLGIWAIPAFLMVEHASLLEACLIVGLFAFLRSGLGPTASLALVELFPPHFRSSASGLAYQSAYAVFGGSAPYLATLLVAGGYNLAPGYYLAGLCAVAAVVAAIGIGNRPRMKGQQTAAANSQTPAGK